jgi:hypothetical protein
MMSIHYSRLTCFLLKRARPNRNIPNRTNRVIAGAEFLVASGIFLFWVVFFTQDVVTIKDSRLKEIYMAFESAFPFADFYLSLMLIIGGLGLLKNKLYGYFFSVVAGASLIFLGILDVSFNLQNGLYSIGIQEAVFNALINLACLCFGIYLLFAIWRSRKIGNLSVS